MIEEELKNLLHDLGWTLHVNTKKSGVYLEAQRSVGGKTRTFHLCSRKKLPQKTAGDIVELLNKSSTVESSGDADTSPDAEP